MFVTMGPELPSSLVKMFTLDMKALGSGSNSNGPNFEWEKSK